MPTGAAPVESSSSPAVAPSAVKPREELNRMLMNLYRPYLAAHPGTNFATLLQGRYGASETRLMTVEQLTDLVSFMEGRLIAAEPQGGDHNAAADAHTAPERRVKGKGKGVAPAKTPGVTEAQLRRLFAIGKAARWTDDDLHIYVRAAFGHDSLKLLKQAEYDLLCGVIQKADASTALTEVGAVPSGKPEYDPNFDAEGPRA